MNGGKKNWLVALSFTAASCASAPNAVEVRPIADPGAKLRASPDSLADAKGQLAIGNVGLALEGFRKASRLDANNAEAFAGMAACYELMRRYDLAQTNYEAALALAPRNAGLLAKLAGALDQQGNAAAAGQVREEIAQLQAASAVLDQAQADPEPQAPAAVALAEPNPEPRELTAPAQSVTVALPATSLAARGPVALPTANTELPPVAVAKASPVAPQPEQPALRAPVLADRTKMNALVGLAATMTPLGVAPLAAMLIPAPEKPEPVIPAPRLDDRSKVSLVTNTAAPRLERLSLGEVALLTGTGTAWRGQVVASTPQKVTVKWVPLTQTAAARPNIRLLNAARVQGLAARNRDYLLDRGWRKIQIGDASTTRDRSLVLYPMLRPQLGRILAAQFGFRAQPTDSSEAFVVLLGRDAPRAAQSRG